MAVSMLHNSNIPSFKEDESEKLETEM